MRDLLWLANRLFLAAVLFTVTAAVANGDQATSPTVSLTGTLSSKSITQDELLRFTVTVENKGSETLKDLRLAAPPDGYRWLRIHTKSPAGTDVYYSDSVEFEDVHNVVFPSVPPGATFTAWGYLLPNVSHKAATLAVEAEWTTGAGKTSVPTFSAPVELGENTVQGEGDILWGYVTILALPVVLALLPFAVNGMLKRRDDRSKTTRLKLNQLQEYTSKYYLPLSAVAQRLVSALKPLASPAQSQPSPNVLLSFYYVIYLEKLMSQQRTVAAGFSFRDLRAEMLATICWIEYSETIFGRDPTDDFSRATQACVNKLRGRENFAAFAQKLGMNAPGVFANADAQRAWQLFQVKLQSISIESLVLDLNALQAVIDYEVNRPFENWYGTTLPPFVVERDVKEKLYTLAKKFHFTPEERKYVDAAEVLPPTE
jgi:hypothetical protein